MNGLLKKVLFGIGPSEDGSSGRYETCGLLINALRTELSIFGSPDSSGSLVKLTCSADFSRFCLSETFWKSETFSLGSAADETPAFKGTNGFLEVPSKDRRRNRVFFFRFCDKLNVG